MMPQFDDVAERSAQEKIARKYRTLGYEVIENPRPDLLPDFMRGVTPDIVARSSSDNVVIEVKRHASLKGSNDLIGIAERLSGQSDWRLELVVLDDVEKSEAISEASYSKMLEYVGTATRNRLFDLAFVYLITILVQTARDLAKKSSVPFKNKSDRNVFLDIGFKGILPDQLLDQCLSALTRRNHILHTKDNDDSLSGEDVQNLLRLCQELRRLL